MKLPPGHVPGVRQQRPSGFGGVGEALLRRMGWEKGQGLGKDKHGMKEALDVKKKEDTLGIGAKEQPGWKWDWKYWEDAYNSGLRSLQGDERADKTKRAKKRRRHTGGGNADSDSRSSSSDSGSDSDDEAGSSSSSSSSSSDSDAEHDARIAAALGAPLPGPTRNRDGTLTSASADELRLAKQLAKDPWGRFGGREGKMARIRRQEEEQAATMAARLGAVVNGDDQQQQQQQQQLPLPVHGVQQVRRADAADPGSSSKRRRRAAAANADAGCSIRNKKAQKLGLDVDSAEQVLEQQQQQQQQQEAGCATAPVPDRKQAPLVVVVDVKAADQAKAFAAFRPTPAVGWWGARMFASAGLLESLEQQPPQKGGSSSAAARTTFDEDMQAAVYMAAHDAQRKGRGGLGQSSKLKIAGGGWKGSKVTFTDDGGDGGGGQNDHADAAAVAAPRSRGAEKVNWVKVAVAQLRSVPGGALKWKRLWRVMAAAAGTSGSERCEARALRRLQRSKRVSVDGKRVSLVAGA